MVPNALVTDAEYSEYAAWAACLPYHSLKALMLKHVYSADFPQDKVKLIKATALVYRVVMEVRRIWLWTPPVDMQLKDEVCVQA